MKFIFKRRETWDQLVAVVADSMEEAKKKFRSGDCTDIEDHFEYTGVEDDGGDSTGQEATERDIAELGEQWWE